MTALSLLLNAYLGEEPKYNMALCHLRLGETDSAVKILNGITKSFRKGTALWRRTEKEWYRAARQTLKEIKQSKKKL